jgi:hypothetical protein
LGHIHSSSSDQEKENCQESKLRDKYLDYCSSQIAEHLLLLSPDEIYLLARQAHRSEGMTGEPSYQDLVRLAQGGISKRLALPSLQEWAKEYEENTGKYEDKFLAIWE